MIGTRKMFPCGCIRQVNAGQLRKTFSVTMSIGDMEDLLNVANRAGDYGAYSSQNERDVVREMTERVSELR